MNTNSLIALTEKNIRQALEDYRAHTYQTDVLDDVSDIFIAKLAADSVKAKTNLRNLFSKSGTWDENLQAIVINGTRTHNPDYTLVSELAHKIFNPFMDGFNSSIQRQILQAIRFFTNPNDDRAEYISAINALAPKAYAPNKKPSRIFKAVCDSLGVTDDTAGSNFQKLFAQFADELSSRKIDFKMFVSINPAHFLTMSNPKEDERGTMLTSCHSFNSTEYSYNCGCVGYARDEVTFIVFTAANPDEPETLNNRKTSRQIFMYQPNNGLLLQSRLYNSFGGTRGFQADSSVYRDLIQREISELEGVPNLWKTFPYVTNKIGCHISCGTGFGGYCDWNYSDFDPKISLRADHQHDFKNFSVGTFGLCVSCGKEICHGLYCDDCQTGDDEICDECHERCDSITGVYNEHGEYIHVCDDCLHELYRLCDDCDDYHHFNEMTEIDDCTVVCSECLSENYFKCAHCDDYYHNDQRNTAIDCDGFEFYICDICRDDYYKKCDDCGCYVHFDDSFTAYDSDGKEMLICPACRDRDYSYCKECDELFHDAALTDGLCANCLKAKEVTA